MENLNNRNELTDYQVCEHWANRYYDKLKDYLEYSDIIQELMIQLYLNKNKNRARTMYFKRILDKLIFENTSNIEYSNINDYENVADIDYETKLDNIEKYSYSINKLKDVLDTLTPREKQVLKLRYYHNLTMEEVGNEFLVTRERIREIEAKALRKLRHPSRVRALQYVDKIKY